MGAEGMGMPGAGIGGLGGMHGPPVTGAGGAHGRGRGGEVWGGPARQGIQGAQPWQQQGQGQASPGGDPMSRGAPPHSGPMGGDPTGAMPGGPGGFGGMHGQG